MYPAVANNPSKLTAKIDLFKLTAFYHQKQYIPWQSCNTETAESATGE